MADKSPAAAGSTPLAGHWDNTIPYFTGAALFHDAVKAGKMRGPDLVLPFQPTNSANDIDNTNNIQSSLWGGRKIVGYAWMHGSANAVGLSLVDGTFTAVVSGGTTNAAGWLLLWLDAVE